MDTQIIATDDHKYDDRYFLDPENFRLEQTVDQEQTKRRKL
jgi:hypothetical protein